MMLKTIPISEAANRIGESQTLAIDAKAKALKSKGLDIIGFAAGEPDFDTPEFIKEAAVKALKEGKTKYTPSSGLVELREAICEKLWKDNQLKYDPKEVIVSCGAKHTIFNIIVSTCNPGDQVLIPAPFWVSYPEMVNFVGAEATIIPTGSSLKVTTNLLDQYAKSNAKLLIINSPSNPTGVVYTRKELEAIANWCLQKNIWIISDEIYEKLWFANEPFSSIANISDEVKQITFVVNGLSKAYSMTGWRIGYVACNKEITDAMGRLQSQSTSNPTSISQYASIAALRGDQNVVVEMCKAYKRRRDLALDLLKKIPGTNCVVPGGAFYLFPSIQNGKINSFKFCEDLLIKANVAAVPGLAFGQEGYIRISYATSDENIKKGIERIAQFISENYQS